MTHKKVRLRYREATPGRKTPQDGSHPRTTAPKAEIRSFWSQSFGAPHNTAADKASRARLTLYCSHATSQCSLVPASPTQPLIPEPTGVRSPSHRDTPTGQPNHRFLPDSAYLSLVMQGLPGYPHWAATLHSLLLCPTEDPPCPLAIALLPAPPTQVTSTELSLSTCRLPSP